MGLIRARAKPTGCGSADTTHEGGRETLLPTETKECHRVIRYPIPADRADSPGPEG